VELSNKSEYALLALLELATCYSQNESLQIRQIAELQNIPSRYLEQLLAILRRGGLIKSIRGARGGYVLTRNPQTITLFDIVSCIEGLDSVENVFDTNPKTLEEEMIQEVWQEACQGANSILQKYTLQDLCERKKSQAPIRLMYYI
jgi:Rrf2 family protein